MFGTKGPSHVMIAENNSFVMQVKDRGGWCMTVDGTNLRLKRLGDKQFVDDKLNKHRCTQCSAVFHNAETLKSHRMHRNCQHFELLSRDAQAQLRHSRQQGARMRGEQSNMVEMVKVQSIGGQVLNCCSEFRYLGTVVTVSYTHLTLPTIYSV